MKNKMNCQIIEDLLPLYIDHLTQDETNEAIQEHLKQCEKCQQKYIDLTADEQIEQPVKEINYLKKIKKSNKRKFKYGVLTTLLVLIAVVIIKVFFIGLAVNSDKINITNQLILTNDDDTRVIIDGTLDENRKYQGYKIDKDHNIILYSSPNILNNDGNNAFHIELPCQNDIDYWYISGQIIYYNNYSFNKKDTNEILLKTKEIYNGSPEVLTTYVHIIQRKEDITHGSEIHSIGDEVESFTLFINEELDQKEMEWISAVCLSFTDNLKKVEFVYEEENAEEPQQKYSFTADDFHLKHDLSYYGEDLEKLNSLYDEIYNQ